MGRTEAGPAAADRAVVDDLLRRAQALHRSGRLDEAAVALEAIVARRPLDGTALVALGEVQARRSATAQAIDLFERALAVDARALPARLGLASELRKQGRLDEALAHAERAMEEAPGDATAPWIAGICHEQANRLDEARALLERAAALDPGNPDIETALARLQRRGDDLDGARARLETVLDRLDVTEQDRASRAWNELGFVLERRGEAGAAFEAFRQAGAHQARTPEAQRLDGHRWSRWIEAYRAAFTPARLAAAPAPGGVPGPRLVFLVGFPRSGTTMTEQMLAAHPAVVTTDEQPFLLDVRRELTGPEPRPVDDLLDALAAADVAEARRRYFGAVESWNPRAGDGAVLVDKAPLNIIEIGWINTLFPDARVLLALRDPRDVCLSCFMQRFGLNTAMVNFLSWPRTAEFYAEVMGLWRDLEPRLTLRTMPVRYEDTVTDFEPRARAIIDFIGVPWDDGVLRFHEKARRRAISTPSFEAVTQRVHTRAVGRWRRYEQHFAAVRDVLAPFVEAFGYEPFPGT